MSRKPKIAHILLICIVALFITAATVDAGTISITPRVKQVIVEEKRGLEISIDNSGDEAAKNAQIHIDLAGVTLSGPLWNTLSPKEEKSHTFFLETLPTAPGNHPVYVTIDFTDLNMYPFTALDVTLINVGADSKPARLFGKSRPASIKKSGKLSFTLKNLDEEPKHVSVRVFGPREINFQATAPMLDLPAGSVIEKTMKVTNFSALAGAAYPVYLVFEYDLSDRHFTYALKSRVSIQAGGISMSSRKTVIFIGIAVVILAALFEIIRRVAKKK